MKNVISWKHKRSKLRIKLHPLKETPPIHHQPSREANPTKLYFLLFYQSVFKKLQNQRAKQIKQTKKFLVRDSI